MPIIPPRRRRNVHRDLLGLLMLVCIATMVVTSVIGRNIHPPLNDANGFVPFPSTERARPAFASPIRTVAGATAAKGKEAPGSTGPRRTHRAPFHLLTLATTIAGEYGVDVPTFAALIEDESAWDPRAVGTHGERGLLQLKAGTARWCGGRINRFEPAANLRCGARYFRAQFDTFGTWELALVAFKAGPASIPDDIPATSWAYAQRTLMKAEAYR
jgi:soluble lytic murein transglycosylase-like protein